MSSNEELLPEGDRDFLKEKEFEFEVVPWEGALHLVIKNYSFPEAYKPRIADLLVQLPAGYPNAKLDMFWTCPDIRLASGNWPAASEVHQIFSGRNWQRWSRHHQGDWRPGVDSLRTFMASVRKEIDKGI